MKDMLTRLRRAWCALRHDWTLHRGFWRCALCQPERHGRREKPVRDDPGTLPLPFDATETQENVSPGGEGIS